MPCPRAQRLWPIRPKPLRGGKGHAAYGAGIEGSGGQLLAALHFTGNHFGGDLRVVHRHVRQLGLAHDVADDEDVGHLGAHLDRWASNVSTPYYRFPADLAAVYQATVPHALEWPADLLAAYSRRSRSTHTRAS